MNPATVSVLGGIGTIFFLFALGVAARRLDYLNEEMLGRLSGFVINLLFPCLIFHSILSGLRPERFSTFWFLPVFGLGMIVAGTLFGLVLARQLRLPAGDIRRTFAYLCAVNNYGFLPLPIIMSLMGLEGVALLFILNIGSSLGLWTIGVAILGGGNGRSRLAGLVNPCTLTLLGSLPLAFLLYALGWREGFLEHFAVLLRCTGFAGQAAVPLIMILIGATLRESRLGEGRAAMAVLSLFRLVFFPLLVFAAAWLLLPVGDRTYAASLRVLLIVAVMPVSSSATIFTRRFGGSPEFASRGVIWTTFLCLLTVPLLLHWAFQLIAAAAAV